MSYHRQREGEGMKIFISRFNEDVTEDILRRKFSKFGNIVDFMLRQKNSNNFAFVEYDCEKAAHKAIDIPITKYLFFLLTKISMNRSNLNGNQILVEMARARDKNRSERPKGCFNCGQSGHFARECPSSPKRQNNERRPREMREDRRREKSRSRSRSREKGYNHRQKERQRSQSKGSDVSY